MLSVIASYKIKQIANPFSDIASFLCHAEECVVWMMFSKMKSNMLTNFGCSPAFFSQKDLF